MKKREPDQLLDEEGMLVRLSTLENYGNCRPLSQFRHWKGVVEGVSYAVRGSDILDIL